MIWFDMLNAVLCGELEMVSVSVKRHFPPFLSERRLALGHSVNL